MRLAIVAAFAALGCGSELEGVVPASAGRADIAAGEDALLFTPSDATDDASCVGCVDLLCAPCVEDVDCGEGARCMPFGESGRFCGRPCTEDSSCPWGYDCTSVSFRADVPGQCTPTSGACSCSPDAIAAGASTSCKVSNEHGSCDGVRSCGPDGLSECKGAVPGPERCNAADDDCDGATDEEFPLGSACGGPCASGHLVCALDGLSTVCDAPLTEPKTETCDGTDEDCDGQTDEGCDDDADGYCDEALPVLGSPGVCPKGDGDCNDDVGATNPGAQERCSSAEDDDCDGEANDPGALGCADYWLDGDSDGTGSAPGGCLCAPAVGLVALSGDCNDGDGTVGPASSEVCGNGKDDDCNGATDEGGLGCTVRYPDADNDGVGALVSPLCTCDPAPPGTAAGTGDCNDDNSAVRPGLPEVCDALDNDCDGTADGFQEPCPTGCGDGLRTCTAGVLSDCSGVVPQCTDGPCCDGCHFKPTTTRCGDSPVATRQTCVGSCAGSVRQETQWAYCSGGSGTCGTSNLVWEDGGLVDNCAATELCTPAGTQASCVACPNGCSEGACSSVVKHTICVDAGYGGPEPGPVSGALQGKDVTLSIAKHLQTYLNADTTKTQGGGAWTVVMTRTTDVDKSIEQRVAACAGADRLVSVMANACGCTSASGVETYTEVGPTNTEKDLAAKIQAQVFAQAGTKDRGVKATDWAVLTGTAAPGCQTFVGFVDGSTDGPLMASDTWRKKVALGLLHGLQLHFGYPAYTPP